MVEEDTEFITFDGVTISKSEYRDAIIEKYITANLNGLTRITDFNIGSEAYHLADVMASLMLEHRESIDLNYRMSMIHTAEGEFLDNLGDPAGVHRKGSSPSTGQVTFTRINPDDGKTHRIIDGLQLSTDDAISFIVDLDEDYIDFQPDENEFTCNVICEQEGSYTNVLPSTIKLINSDLASYLSVTNQEAMEGGEDIEEDDDYRTRILLSPYNVPTGTLAWYENVALTEESVHDVRVEKGETQLDKDIKIIYNPSDWEDTSIARNALESLFSMKEYDVAGVAIEYVLCNKVPVLADIEDTIYFAVLLEQNYSLNMVKEEIINKIRQFNSDAMIGIEFNPGNLTSIIENEVTGIGSCRIVEYDNITGSYVEIVAPISVGDDDLFFVDMTDIEDRIREMRFHLDIELEG